MFVSATALEQNSDRPIRIVVEAAGVFLLSLASIMVAAAAAGSNPFEVGSYNRWDTGLYLLIATDGYHLLPCPAQYGPGTWCGNAGWFPGYPLAIRLVAASGLEMHAAALLVSAVFFFLSLIVLRRLIGELSALAPTRWVFLMAAVFPGSIYYLAMFPISMMLFFLLLSMLWASRGRFIPAAIAAAGAGFSYSTGFLGAGLVFFSALIWSSRPWPARIGLAVMCGMIAATGLIAVLTMHHIATERWDAFFLTQAKYGHGIHNPLKSLQRIWSSLTATAVGKQEAFALELQSLVMHFSVPAILLALLARARTAHPVEILAAIQVALFGGFALMMGPAVSLVRVEATLLPLVLLTARLPAAACAVLIALFAFLKFEVAVAFFKSVAM